MEENIKLPLMYANLEKDAEFQQHFHEITHRISITSVLTKKPLECSGGQRARAAFARAIMMKPQIILADEPTASLDEKNRERIMDLLFEMNRVYHTTILTVTHDLVLAHRHKRTIILESKL